MAELRVIAERADVSLRCSGPVRTDEEWSAWDAQRPVRTQGAPAPTRRGSIGTAPGSSPQRASGGPLPLSVAKGARSTEPRADLGAADRHLPPSPAASGRSTWNTAPPARRGTRRSFAPRNPDRTSGVPAGRERSPSTRVDGGRASPGRAPSPPRQRAGAAGPPPPSRPGSREEPGGGALEPGGGRRRCGPGVHGSPAPSRPPPAPSPRPPNRAWTGSPRAASRRARCDERPERLNGADGTGVVNRPGGVPAGPARSFPEDCGPRRSEPGAPATPGRGARDGRDAGPRHAGQATERGSDGGPGWPRPTDRFAAGGEARGRRRGPRGLPTATASGQRERWNAAEATRGASERGPPPGRT